MNIRREITSLLLFSLAFLLVVPQVSAQILTIGEIRAKGEQGSPIYLDETVTVQGIVAVDSGLWHDSANYFAIIDPASSSEGVLVYLPGTTQPAVQEGSLVQVTGQLGNRGYATDVGSLVILVTDPENVQTLELDYGFALDPKPIATDASEELLAAIEGGFVKIEGRLFDYSNSGIVRGFWLDGSQDGNIEDGKGAMYFKFYNYAGIDISELHNGCYVVATGILLKADERHGGYYIRPVNGDSITEVSEKSVPADFYGPQGLSFELGTPQQMREYGLIELVSLQTSLPLDREAYPEWNPDGGSLIATIGVEQGARITREAAERNLFLYDFSGSAAPKQLTFEYYPHAYPRWSPDGKRLIYAAAPNLDQPEGNWNIYLWDLENAAVKVTDHPSYDITPTWSPDGGSIIFSSNRNGKWDLWWQSLDSEEAIQLTSDPADVLFPDWGTTGLVFQRRGSAGRFELWRAEIVMDNGRPILDNEICLTTDMDASNVYPRWSPKGDRIAFMSSDSGQWDLWLMDSDGENKERLTKCPGNFLFPAWHPNGRRLACVGELASTESPSLYMLDIAGASKAKHPKAEVDGEVVVVGRELAPNLLSGPVNNVIWPLLTQPALVSPGSELTVCVRGVPEEDLSVVLQSVNFAYEFSGSQVDGKLTFLLPDDLPLGLYDLCLRSASVRDRQPRAVSVREPQNRIAFALVTDIHPELSYRDENNKLRPVIRELNELDLDFAVFTGDLVGKNADNYHEDYPELYNLLEAEAQFPFFMVMGNHDGKVSGSVDGFSYWQSYFGELYYTFDVDDWRFVAINTYDHPDYPSENGFIKEEQLGWLENQLGLAQTNQKPTIAFLHHNPFDTRWRFIDEGQKRLRELLEIYGVSHVFAGHRHSDQLEQTITSTIVTTQWVEPESSNSGFRVVTIEGNHVRELQR
jgi:Icc-related predicted phosphoesterase